VARNVRGQFEADGAVGAQALLVAEVRSSGTETSKPAGVRRSLMDCHDIPRHVDLLFRSCLKQNATARFNRWSAISRRKILTTGVLASSSSSSWGGQREGLLSWWSVSSPWSNREGI